MGCFGHRQSGGGHGWIGRDNLQGGVFRHDDQVSYGDAHGNGAGEGESRFRTAAGTGLLGRATVRGPRGLGLGCNRAAITWCGAPAVPAAASTPRIFSIERSLWIRTTAMRGSTVRCSPDGGAIWRRMSRPQASIRRRPVLVPNECQPARSAPHRPDTENDRPRTSIAWGKR